MGASGDVRGRLLEIMDSTYTDWLGSDLSGKHVLDVDPANLQATILADLAAADEIPDEASDWFILHERCSSSTTGAPCSHTHVAS